MISAGQHRDMPWKLRVSRGEAETSWINKFGYNPDIDTNTTPEDVWSGGGVYTFTADGGADYYISSSNAGDTQTVSIRILSEDANGDWNQEDLTVTLQGQTKTAITPASGDKPVRFYRGYNTGTTDFAGNVYIYENDDLTAGVPDTATKVRGVIVAGENQTEMAIYTIPSGYKGYLWKGAISLTSTIRTASMQIARYARLHGGVFRVQGRISLDTGGSNWYQREYEAGLPSIPAKTDIKITVVEVSANAMAASAELDIFLEKL